MRSGPLKWTVLYTALLLTALSPLHAAFELKALPPAERGAMTPMAEALPPYSHGQPQAKTHDGIGLRSLQVYGFRPFGLGEASFISASAGITLGSNLDFGIAYQSLSVLSYVEQICILQCEWKIGKLRLGPAVRVGAVSLDGSYVDHALLFDIACHARVLRDLRIFFGAGNPFALGLVRAGEACPTDVTAGLGYEVSERLTFGIEVFKESGFPTSIASGVEVRLVERVRLRCGIRTYPKEFGLGVGLRIGGFALDISANLHLDLGVTHEAGVTYMRE